MTEKRLNELASTHLGAGAKAKIIAKNYDEVGKETFYICAISTVYEVIASFHIAERADKVTVFHGQFHTANQYTLRALANFIDAIEGK